MESLWKACKQNPNVKIKVLLDCLRATRGRPENSVTMLQPLLKEYPNRVSVSLFHTPRLRGIMKKLIPSRVNEIIGVQHIKAYVFDDDLLISGANLADTYFTNRQDRYMWVNGNEHLCEYFNSLIQTISTFSYTLSPDGKFLKEKADPLGNYQQFVDFSRNALQPFIDSNSTLPFNIQNTDSDTWILPTLQMGVSGVRHDEQVITQLLRMGSEETIQHISSPYLNLSKHNVQLLLETKSKLNILTASPKANGFYTAKDISRIIPTCYSVVEEKLFNEIAKRGQDKNINIYEYVRSGWTFHAKGIWMSYPHKPNSPSITIIGSANLGERSSERDLEAQLMIVTSNAQLKKKLEEERNHLFNGTELVTKETFQRTDRKASFFTRLLCSVFSDFL